jgi:hypothetical protein
MGFQSAEALALAARQAPRTAPDGHESAITYFRGRNVAKPAGYDLQLPNIDLTLRFLGNGVAPLQPRTAGNVVVGSKSAAQPPGYP